MRTNRVSFRSEVPLTSAYREIQQDSARLQLIVQPKLRHAVIPFLIFRSNKSMAKFTYQLFGKGLTGREYSLVCRNLVITRGEKVIGKTSDPDALKEEVVRTVQTEAISPKYATPSKVILPDARKAELKVHLEFELVSRKGIKESFTIDVPLERIPQKSFTLFNPFKS